MALPPRKTEVAMFTASVFPVPGIPTIITGILHSLVSIISFIISMYWMFHAQETIVSSLITVPLCWTLLDSTNCHRIILAFQKYRGRGRPPKDLSQTPLHCQRANAAKRRCQRWPQKRSLSMPVSWQCLAEEPHVSWLDGMVQMYLQTTRSYRRLDILEHRIAAWDDHMLTSYTPQ